MVEEPPKSLTGGSIILNATAEFCRTLGDIPTYGQAGNRDEDVQELMVNYFKVFIYVLNMSDVHLGEEQ